MSQLELIRDLCKALAFHVVETELTLAHMDGEAIEMKQACADARDLISAAGFVFDDLYPVAERPIAFEGPEPPPIQ